MLRFVFPEAHPVELVAKIKSKPTDAGGEKIAVEPIQPINVKDAVLTIDGTEPRGQKPWNMIDAIRGRYTIAYRLVSVPERFQWFLMNGTPLQQTELNLTPEEAQKTLRLGLHKSVTFKFTKPYHLLKANCTNLALQLLKEANPLRKRSLEIHSPVVQFMNAALDRVLPGEALTQFTALRLRVLGWFKRKEKDLQLDPEFQTEVKEVLADYRESVLSRDDLAAADKTKLLTDMGLHEGDHLLENPKLYRKALKQYTSALKQERASLVKSCSAAFGPAD